MRKYFERSKNENMTYKICGLHLEQYSKGNVCIFMYFASVCVCRHARVQSCPTLQPHGLQPTRLLCPWDSPGKNTGVGCHFLLQRIFLTQELNPRLLHLLHWQSDCLPLSTWEAHVCVCVCVKSVTCKIWWTDFPAGPVAKTSPWESRGPRFNPWSRH